MQQLKRLIGLLITICMLLSLIPLTAFADSNDVAGKEAYQILYSDIQKISGGIGSNLSFDTSDTAFYFGPYHHAVKLKFDLSNEKFSDFITKSVIKVKVKPDTTNELLLYAMQESVSDESITPFNAQNAVLAKRTSGDVSVVQNKEYYYEFEMNSIPKQLENSDVVAFNLFNSADGARLSNDRIILTNYYMTADEVLASISESSSSDYIAKCIRFAVGESAYNAFSILSDSKKEEITALAKASYESFGTWKAALEEALKNKLLADSVISVSSQNIQKLSTNYHSVTSYAGTDTWNGANNAHKIKISTTDFPNKNFIAGLYLDFKAKSDSTSEPEIYVTSTSYEDILNDEAKLDISSSSDVKRVTEGDYALASTYEYNADISEFCDVIKENDGAAFIVYNILTDGIRVDFSSFKLTAVYITAEDAVMMYKTGKITADELFKYVLSSKEYSDYSYLTTRDKNAVNAVAGGDFEGYENWKSAVLTAISENTSETEVIGDITSVTNEFKSLSKNGNNIITGYAAENNTFFGKGGYLAQKIIFDASEITFPSFIETAEVTIDVNTDSTEEPEIYLMPTTTSNDDYTKEAALDKAIAPLGVRTTSDAIVNHAAYQFKFNATAIVKEKIVGADSLAYILYNVGGPTRMYWSGSLRDQILKVSYVSGEKAVIMYKNGEVTADECLEFIFGSQIASTYLSMTDSEKAEIKNAMSKEMVSLEDWKSGVEAKIAEFYGSADASFTTGLVNTNQDILYKGVSEKSLESVLVNGVLTSQYTYDSKNARLTVDKDLFPEEGDYDVKAVFTDANGNKYDLGCVIGVSKQYIYKNNFDEYDEAALASDAFGQQIGSGVTGASLIAPEWSLLTYMFRYDEETFRKAGSNSLKGKIQNRIVDYKLNNEPSKGIMLENISASENELTVNMPSVTLDLDRVYGKAINKETLGSDKLNFSFSATFDYTPEYAEVKTLGFNFDNCISQGSWRTGFFKFDPNWGVTAYYPDETGVAVEYKAYEKVTGNYINYNIGNFNNSEPWYIAEGNTVDVSMTLDMADMNALKLYVNINGKDYRFEYTKNGESIKTDYIPLPNNPKVAGKNLSNFFDILEPSWIGGMFPNGYDGLTMLKFLNTDPSKPIVIDNVTVQSEIARLKTAISEVGSRSEAKAVYKDYLELSDADKKLVNNIALLKNYDLFEIFDAKISENTVTADISAVTHKEFKVICSLYENNGRYTTLTDKKVIESKDLAEKVASFSFDEISEETVVKVMIWDNDLKYPLCDAVEIK